MRLLLDEMYPPALAKALRALDIEAHTAAELALAGQSDGELFAAATADGLTIVTENVADFACVSAEHLVAGGHHPGVLIALSSRFSRRPAGIPVLAAAVLAVATQPLDDRTVYLSRTADR